MKIGKAFIEVGKVSGYCAVYDVWGVKVRAMSKVAEHHVRKIGSNGATRQDYEKCLDYLERYKKAIYIKEKLGRTIDFHSNEVFAAFCC